AFCSSSGSAEALATAFSSNAVMGDRGQFFALTLRRADRFKTPTFETEGALSVEVHLFDFADEIYGRDLRVEFAERIRDEVRFSGPDALAEQLRKDEARSRSALFA